MSVALVAVALITAAPGQPAGFADEPEARNLPQLQAELVDVTARAQRLAGDLEAAAARDGGLRVALDRLAQSHELAQHQLDARARVVYMRTTPDPLERVTRGLAGPALRHLIDRGSIAALTVDRALIDEVAGRSREVRALQERSAAYHQGLRRRAAPILAAQDKARSLLAVAAALAAQQRSAAVLASLDEQRAALDTVSATVTAALTPAQTRRSQRAAAEQIPVLAAVEAGGFGYPGGYRSSGQVVEGTASWYGPGFVGRPTASGAPYDPERLTCASQELPLGTVIRVSANGRAVSCLVNDRGPYVGDRVLDMSRAGSRALGYDGLAEVVIEVLERA